VSASGRSDPRPGTGAHRGHIHRPAADRHDLPAYGRFLKGIVLGAHYRAVPTVTYCPPPCFGYSFRNQLPVWPQMISDVPVTLLERATGIEPA
jgi:hypothetical protein